MTNSSQALIIIRRHTIIPQKFRCTKNTRLGQREREKLNAKQKQRTYKGQPSWISFQYTASATCFLLNVLVWFSILALRCMSLDRPCVEQGNKSRNMSVFSCSLATLITASIRAAQSHTRWCFWLHFPGCWHDACVGRLFQEDCLQQIHPAPARESPAAGNATMKAKRAKPVSDALWLQLTLWNIRSPMEEIGVAEC